MDLGLVSEIPEHEYVIKNRFSGANDTYFEVARGGYGWIFPYAGYYSVGIVGTAKYLGHPKQVMRDFLWGNGLSEECLIRSHIIPAGLQKKNHELKAFF